MRRPPEQRTTKRITAVDLAAKDPELRRVVADAGKKLREIRNGQGWSLSELAIKSGGQSANTSLSRAERGEDPGITLFRLYKYAASMGYTVEVNFVKRKGRK